MRGGTAHCDVCDRPATHAEEWAWRVGFASDPPQHVCDQCQPAFKAWYWALFAKMRKADKAKAPPVKEEPLLDIMPDGWF